jgi:thioesterase domain-containing protein
VNAPVFNINFCGTNVAATRPTAASLRAIRQFDNHLIISGVAAPDAYDQETGLHYPMPGTYEVDEELRQRVRYPWMNQHFSMLQQCAGFLWGEGEDANLNYAMLHVKKRIKDLAVGEKMMINLTGYSRGAASAVHFANDLYRQYGERIRLNLFIVDPNAGLGRQHFQAKKCIPSNVDNFYVVFNRLETWSFLKPLSIPHYNFRSAKTHVTALHVAEDHVYQEQLLPDDQMCGAKVNQQLIEMFLDSYGAKRKSGEPMKKYSFKDLPLVQKGFVSFKSKETPLDQAIRQMNSVSVQENHRQIQENQYLKQFNAETADALIPAYQELSYYFSHFLSEIDREYATANEQEQAALLLQATDNLIKALTPSKKYTPEQQKKALQAFYEIVRKNQYHPYVIQICAHIVALAAGLISGVAFACTGFCMGLTCFDTFGFAALPYTVMGFYRGFNVGFAWGKYQMLGHQNAEHIERSARKSIEMGFRALPEVGVRVM